MKTRRSRICLIWWGRGLTGILFTLGMEMVVRGVVGLSLRATPGVGLRVVMALTVIAESRRLAIGLIWCDVGVGRTVGEFKGK